MGALGWCACLQYLIDLAGSESVKRTKAVGRQVKEAGRINRSLLALERVVAGIEMAQKGCVRAVPARRDALGPYRLSVDVGFGCQCGARRLLSSSTMPSTRDSKLTRFLKPAIGGNAFTAIICTLTPDESQLFESLNTISFGLRAKNIKNIAKLNEVRADKTDRPVVLEVAHLSVVVVYPCARG